MFEPVGKRAVAVSAACAVVVAGGVLLAWPASGETGQTLHLVEHPSGEQFVPTTDEKSTQGAEIIAAGKLVDEHGREVGHDALNLTITTTQASETIGEWPRLADQTLITSRPGTST